MSARDHSGTPPPVNQSATIGFTAIVATALLAIAIWRVFALVFHEPLLAYANNYDMIRLQACHQIWPADPTIEPGAASIERPLRDYTLARQLETSCFFSSELLFTTPAALLGQLQSRWRGDPVISIRLVGFCKAAVLVLTMVLAHWHWWRRRESVALLGHASVALLVLSDPAVTLYLNTFYSEFSAVYFLYLALLGLAMHQARWPACLPLWLGLAGLTFSKPQHMPLALLLGALASGWLWRSRRKPLTSLATALCVLAPLLLLTSGTLSNRDDTMSRVNKTNLLGAMLSSTTADARIPLLETLALPMECLTLTDSNWHKMGRDGTSACAASASLRYGAVLAHFLREPDHLLRMVWHAIPKTQRWVVAYYGQVEGQTLGKSGEYLWSVHSLLKPVPTHIYIVLFCAPVLLVSMALLTTTLLLTTTFLLTTTRRRQPGLSPWCRYFGLLSVLQWSVVIVAVVGDGFVDIPKHTHLATTLLLAQYALLPAYALKVLQR